MINMASTYPTALDTLATNKSNITTTTNDHPQHHNDIADAVNKVEAELGTDPSGAAATVKARLDTADTTTAAISTKLTNNGKGVVIHGATAGTARPTGFASIEWIGSVAPTNAVNNDTWVNTA